MNFLSPGSHTFISSNKNLSFEYIVIHPSQCQIQSQNRNQNPEQKQEQDYTLITIQCPAWGIGSAYLQSGLSPLTTYTNNSNSNNNILLFFHPRGTDRSSRPTDASEMCTMPHLASDLDDLRVHLGLNTFPVLLGHSNGGAIALSYAEMYPDRVQKLILLNHQLVGMRDRADSKVFCEDERYAYAYRALMESSRETDEEFTRSVREMWPLYFWDPWRYVPVLIMAIGKDRVMPVWCYQSVYGCDQALANPMQMIEGLGRVQAETLIIFGRDDLICGLKIADRSLQEIEKARLVVYDHCGHFPWIEQRQRTLDDIADLLDSQTLQ